MNKLKKLFDTINIKGNILFSEPMNKHTSFQVGGPADIFVQPGSVEELKKILTLSRLHSLPVTVLGGGTNVLVSDDGVEGVVISLKGLRGISPGEKELSAEAGAEISDVSAAAGKVGLSGLEFIYAMPGTVGGALFMNARCYGREISDVLSGATVLNENLEVKKLSIIKEDFSYKRSPFQGSSGIILEARFSMAPGNPKKMKNEMDKIRLDREEKGHFLFPCAGSVFKNNRAFGRPSGAIIDSLGLKGYTLGKAKISEKHANIIVNPGGARAADIYGLICLARDRVKEAYGFELEPEVLLIGRWEVEK